ncbi:WD40-repeat-containing domain [Trinorchestia longiramus]|nr:WD40-repeat-containing domain [Trinorchestia longiramus]
MLATGGDCIKLWDLNDFKLQQIFPSKLGSSVQSLSWSNNGGCLGSFSSGSTEVSLRAIRDSSSLELPPIKASSSVRAVDHAHKAACYLAVAESSGRVVVWDAKQLTSKKSFQDQVSNGQNDRWICKDVEDVPVIK